MRHGDWRHVDMLNGGFTHPADMSDDELNAEIDALNLKWEEGKDFHNFGCIIRNDLTRLESVRLTELVQERRDREFGYT